MFDRWLGPPLGRLLTVVHRLKGEAEPPREIRRIVVIVLSEMGALVLARPMFERLTEKYAGASLFVLCFDKNRPAIELLDVVPREHVIGLRGDSFPQFVADSARAVRRIRALRLDAVLDLELF